MSKEWRRTHQSVDKHYPTFPCPDHLARDGACLGICCIATWHAITVQVVDWMRRLHELSWVTWDTTKKDGTSMFVKVALTFCLWLAVSLVDTTLELESFMDAFWLWRLSAGPMPRFSLCSVLLDKLSPQNFDPGLFLGTSTMFFLRVQPSWNATIQGFKRDGWAANHWRNIQALFAANFRNTLPLGGRPQWSSGTGIYAIHVSPACFRTLPPGLQETREVSLVSSGNRKETWAPRLRKGLCSQCVCFSFFSSAAFYARLGIANLLQFELLRHGGWGSFNGTDCQHCWRLPDRQVLAMLVLNASLGYVAQLSPTYSPHFRCEICELGKSLKSVKVPSASLHKVLLILFSDDMNIHQLSLLSLPFADHGFLVRCLFANYLYSCALLRWTLRKLQHWCHSVKIRFMFRIFCGYSVDFCWIFYSSSMLLQYLSIPPCGTCWICCRQLQSFCSKA